MKNQYWILGVIALGAFLLWKKAQAGIVETIKDEGVEDITQPDLDFSGIKFL